MKRFLGILLVCAMMLALVGCGRSTGSAASSGPVAITVAYQSSVGYAPLLVMKQFGMIEEAYGKDITVNWVEMNNGSAINEGIVAGSIDVGSMGVPVAVTGILAGVPYRIAFGLSAQPYSILTNSQDINRLSDFSATDQIAITNINSQPHILLAMAAKAELGDAHALDKNLTVLKNSDGYTAIVSGAVCGHMVISPYNFMELAGDAGIHEIPVSEDVWPADNTALVGVVSNKLHENTALYDALMKAVDKAMAFIAEHPQETAELLAQGYDASAGEIQTWITDRRSSYDAELHGVMDMIGFMLEEGFLESGPSSIRELVYDNVRGN